jgi:peptidoglycan hydrolase CwlO-like protein
MTMKEQIEILEADIKRLEKEIAEAYAEVNDSRSVICNLENELSEWKMRAEKANKPFLPNSRYR